MVTNPRNEGEQELKSALTELREAYDAYQRRFRKDPLSEFDDELLKYEELLGAKTHYELAEERYRAALRNLGRLVPYNPAFDEEGFGSHRLRDLRDQMVEPPEVHEGLEFVTRALGPGADWVLKSWLLDVQPSPFEPSTLKRALQFEEISPNVAKEHPFYSRAVSPAAFAYPSKGRWRLSTGEMPIEASGAGVRGKVVKPEHGEAVSSQRTGALVWRGLFPEDRKGYEAHFWMEPAFMTIHQLVTIAGAYWHRLAGESEVVLAMAVRGLGGRRLIRLEPRIEIGSTSTRQLFEYRSQINSLDLHTNVLRLALQISEMLFESFDWRSHADLLELQNRAITLAF